QALPAGELRVSPDQRILLLATERTSTMQEELDQAVQLGFHVISSASAGYDEIAYLLQRREEPLPHGPYHLLATRRLSTMEKELNQTAAQGYRLHPQSVLYNDCELVLLMEPLAREDARYQYRVLGTERTSTLQRELEEAYAQGFHLVDLVSADDNIAVLERETRP
ncbi:MAG TPA: hypothetical protein VLV83_04985, partial [Acidobacteriota bacterium]|nr:hypothetical protein [Acidobacteriota bacterium]